MLNYSPEALHSWVLYQALEVSFLSICFYLKTVESVKMPSRRAH